MDRRRALLGAVLLLHQYLAFSAWYRLPFLSDRAPALPLWPRPYLDPIATRSLLWLCSLAALTAMLWWLYRPSWRGGRPVLGVLFAAEVWVVHWDVRLWSVPVECFLWLTLVYLVAPKGFRFGLVALLLLHALGGPFWLIAAPLCLRRPSAAPVLAGALAVSGLLGPEYHLLLAFTVFAAFRLPAEQPEPPALVLTAVLVVAALLGPLWLTRPEPEGPLRATWVFPDRTVEADGSRLHPPDPELAPFYNRVSRRLLASPEFYLLVQQRVDAKVRR